VPDEMRISFTLNGTQQTAMIKSRHTLADVLRDKFGCTGVHLGCEQGVCGACTVVFNGRTARACLLLGVQADGASIVTIEGMPSETGELHPLQQTFSSAHGLQCGFCTPGMIITAAELIHETPAPTETQIREALSGNLCRCTGYANIVLAVCRAAEAGDTDRGAPWPDSGSGLSDDAAQSHGGAPDD
jgi:aerobic carbon-monoxide dehydrogenase small subunit